MRRQERSFESFMHPRAVGPASPAGKGGGRPLYKNWHYVFTASFDYSQRGLFALALALSSAYAGVHLMRTFLDRESPADGKELDGKT
jgi:hypothetical protein